MPIGVPTRPATAWHGPRAQSIMRLECVIPALARKVSVLDLNRSGVLLSTEMPLRVGSSHAARFRFDTQAVELAMRVSHVTSHFDADDGWRYRVGLSFRLGGQAAWKSLETLMSALSVDKQTSDHSTADEWRDDGCGWTTAA